MHEEQYSFQLVDCLEIWRWLTQDLSSSQLVSSENDLEINEFEVGRDPV